MILSTIIQLATELPTDLAADGAAAAAAHGNSLAGTAGISGGSSALPVEIEFGGKMMKFAWPIMVLAWTLMFGEQVMAMRAGHKADWWKPSIRVVGFLLLLGLYSQFAAGIISAVHLAGGMDSPFTTITQGDSPVSTDGVLAKRVKEFEKVRDKLADEQKANDDARRQSGDDSIFPSEEDLALWGESLMHSAIDTILYAITWFTFTFAAFAIFAIKCMSGAVTNILLEVGPLMIAFAALPGLTSKYLSAWVMALVEVTAWGPVSAIILGMMARVNEKSAGLAIMEDANYAEHIVLNFVYAGLLIAVPSITHMILSGSAASVGSTGMAAAMGALAGAGKKATGAAQAVGGAAATKGAEAAKTIKAAAERRLSDATSGAETHATIQSSMAPMASTLMNQNNADKIQSQKDARRDHFAIQGASEKRRGD